MVGARFVGGSVVLGTRLALAVGVAIGLVGCGGGANGSDAGTQLDATSQADARSDAQGDAGTDVTPTDASHDAKLEAHTSDGSTGSELVRFVAIGDTGQGNSIEADVARAVERKCMSAGCDFAILLGDNIYNSGVSSSMDPQWVTKFEGPFARLSFDFYPALGNHDYGGGGVGDEWEKGQFQVDYTAQSQKWKMPAHYHSFKKEHVEFFVLDTNSQMYGRDGQQRTDMAALVNASTATWKIAYGHHPYLSNGPHGNAGTYDGTVNVTPWSGVGVKSFLEGIVCGKTDVYFCGHDHSLQWLTDTCSGTELIVSGAGSQTTSVNGTNPVRFEAADPGFVYVRIEGRTLTATIIDSAGRDRFTRTVTK